ncbi:MAG: hypothetical protein ACP5HK_01495 [Acidilobus sp.]
MAAALAEALSVVTYSQGVKVSINALLWDVSTMVVIVLASSASVLMTDSLVVGVAISLSPITVASNGLSLIMALSASASSATASGISYALLKLRRGRQPKSAIEGGPPSRSISPVPTAVTSLILYTLWLMRLPIISGAEIGEGVYSALTITAAVLASVRSRSIAEEIAYGALASLGPFGLAMVAAMTGRRAGENAVLFNSLELANKPMEP